MNIGDKVRTIHGNEEGIIIAFKENNLVEIEIEDGFSIPALKSDLVVVSTQESKHFEREEKAEPVRPVAKKVEKPQGIYICFEPITSDIHQLVLINNSSAEVLVSFGEKSDKGYKAVEAKHVAKKSFGLLGRYSLQYFERWPKFSFQMLFHQSGSEQHPPMARDIKFRAKSFFKAKQDAPVTGKEGFVFQIDREDITINPESIVEHLSEKKPNAEKGAETAEKLKPSSSEIDLHIETLTPKHDALSPSDIFSIQIEAFEKELDKAIASGTDITFIHGVGNYVLRNEIHKRLSGNLDIKSFKDAQKEKFGYGATFVKVS